MYESDKQNDGTGREIAAIGITVRLPDAKNTDEFWENLKNGLESIFFLADEELEELGVVPELSGNPNYVKTKGSVVADKEYFDAFFFDYTPREAEIMDPQIRIFHECVWECLEDAGYYSKTYNGLIGLYGGATGSSYWEVLTFLSGKTDDFGTFASGHLNNKDFINSRIAYKLDLKGPIFAVYSACSTSLLAIHLACQAILSGECDMALAGGITITTQEKAGYLFQEGMVNSQDGHCRAFDARAAGFVGGNGAGVVLLKSLEDALADRDHIYALVTGTASNNDGIRKMGYTAPSVEGQADAIRVALQMAEVEPESIGYIETHGTGTQLGDLVELEALKLAFNSSKKGFCAVGSVKTNIGHTDSAAGAAAFIKTILVLKHKMIPPSLNFETPNPRFHFENSPFYVNTKLRQWENGKYPLRAGVSSFGIGGTNVHVILEEAPEGTGGLAPLPDAPPLREYQLLLLSAKTQTALERMTRNLADYFKKNLLNSGNSENPTNPGQILADAAYTLQVGRGAFKYRRMLTCSTIDEAIDALSSSNTVKVKTGQVKGEETPVIFIFPGIGSQYVNMGLELYQKEPLFRREMDCCFDILDSLLDEDIKEILYPGESAGAQDNQGRGIDSFDIAQLLTFIIGYALAKLLIKWGIKPYAVIGYSFGEYTAACISGVLILEDALKLVVLRGKLINKLPPGAMLSVPLTRQQLKPLLSLHHGLSLAIDNGPSCIVAGPKDTVDAFEEEMKRNGNMCMRLQAARAIHSTMMEPILKEFEAAVGQVKGNEPQIPYISNVTGDWLTTKEAPSPHYWAVHLRETVQFADGIKKLTPLPNAVFIEVGPGRDLTTLITRHLEDNPGHRAVNIVRHPTQKVSDLSFLLNRIGRAWLLGVEIDWPAFHANEKRYRLPLPTYPFDRQCYKIEGDMVTFGVKRFNQLDQTGRKPDIADWFYIPSWKRLNLTADKIGRVPDRACWLLFIDDIGLGATLAKQLGKKGQEVITVQTGAAFLKESHRQYYMNPHRQNGNDYDTLFSQLKQQDMIPDRIIHLWGITESHNKGADMEIVEQTRDLGFYSLIYIARAIDKHRLEKKIQIKVITKNINELIGS
jgi:phthiocerol/phenolphthiocerol synthesis type-I polyketide synthase E